MKIITVIGARPQFIKAAVVSRAINLFNEKNSNIQINEIIIHTGQHFDKNMSEIFFEEMHIPRPHYNLNIGGLTHGAMTGRMLEEIEKILVSERPDTVLVYGDTNSTLAGALAASKLGIPVAHVEAGLRSHNYNMPEEINRILTDQISSWLFCPTVVALENLKAEGIYFRNHHKIYNVGDVMYDAALFYSSQNQIKNNNTEEQPIVLATIHRAENTDSIERLSPIIHGLNSVGEQYRVVVPLHPRTKKKIKEFNINTGSLDIIEPVGYIEMLGFLRHCKFVITDSGGLQKEAFFFKKPCVVIREETEWVELVEHGSNVLAGANYNHILDAVKTVESGEYDFSLRLYGDGEAGKKIVEALVNS